MKIIQLVRCEFIKNFSVKRFIITVLVLSLCCFGLIKFEEFYKGNSYSELLSVTEKELEVRYENAKKEYANADGIVKEGIFSSYEKILSSYQLLDEEISDGKKINWKESVLYTIQHYIPKLEAMITLTENYQSLGLKNYLENHEKYNSFNESVYVEAYYISTLNRFFDFELPNIKEEITFLESQLSLLEEALEKNLYYLVCQFSYNQILFDAEKHDIELNKATVEAYQYMIQHKISDPNDYRALNAKEYQQFAYSEENRSIPTLEEYRKGLVNPTFNGYAASKKYNLIMREEEKNQRKILKYAMDHELKHDAYLKGDDVEDLYLTSKNFMNLGLHLGIVILFLSAIYHAGIVAREHDKGTIKFLLTKPIKREKILLSKIIYLILDTYLLWLLGSLILFLIVGFYSGFGDLFTAKLIVSHGEVIKVNYLLWYFKELLICGIPICCFQVVLFSLSALTLNTSLTASIISILTVFSFMIWFLISQLGLTFLDFLSYTPIPYLDYWFVRYNSRIYLEAVVRSNVFTGYGLLIGIIVAVLLTIITLLIYRKRDIKN